MGRAAGTLLSVHLASTAAMTGVIWFVQVVHYPLFHLVGRSGYETYQASHQRRTAFVVGPLMGLESLSAVVLLLDRPDGLAPWLPIVGLVLLAAIHASTITLQVPQHSALARRHDDARIDRLVRTNWVRTIGWSARTVLGVAMLVVWAPA